jgi:MscS family membrane protein
MTMLAAGAWGRPAWVDDLPEAWHESWLGLAAWQWAGLGALLAAAALLGWLTFVLLAAVLRLERRLRAGGVSPYAGRGIRRAASLLATVLAYDAMSRWLDLPVRAAHGLGLALFAVEVALCVWLGIAIWGAAVDVYANRRRSLPRRVDALVLPFARKLGALLIGAVGASVVIAGLGYNVAAFVAGLGIGGIAVALAAKNSIENLFGSLGLMLDVPFGVGDWIKIAGVSGVVEEIGLRTTRVRTFEDSLVTIPNSLLTQHAVENMGMRRRRRFAAHLWLGHDADPDAIERFIAALRAAVDQTPEIVHEDASVSLYDAGLDGLDVQMVVHFDVATFGEEAALRQRLLLAALRLARAEGLPLAERAGRA